MSKFFRVGTVGINLDQITHFRLNHKTSAQTLPMVLYFVGGQELPISDKATADAIFAKLESQSE
jgi:hypothetical protein